MQQGSSHLLQKGVWQTPHFERAQGMTPRRCFIEHLVLRGALLRFSRAFGSLEKSRIFQIFRSGFIQAEAPESCNFETQFAPAQSPGARFAVAFQSYVFLFACRSSLRHRFTCQRDQIEQVSQRPYPFEISDIPRRCARFGWAEVGSRTEREFVIPFHCQDPTVL